MCAIRRFCDHHFSWQITAPDQHASPSEQHSGTPTATAATEQSGGEGNGSNLPEQQPLPGSTTTTTPPPLSPPILYPVNHILKVEILNVPEPPKLVNSWTLRHITAMTEGVSTLPYPLQPVKSTSVMAPSGGGGNEATATTTTTTMTQSTPPAPPPFTFRIPLAPTIVVDETDLHVACYDVEQERWTEDGISGVEIELDDRNDGGSGDDSNNNEQVRERERERERGGGTRRHRLDRYFAVNSIKVSRERLVHVNCGTRPKVMVMLHVSPSWSRRKHAVPIRGF